MRPSREIVAIYIMSGRTDQALLEIKAIQKRHPSDMRGYVLEGDFWAGSRNGARRRPLSGPRRSTRPTMAWSR